MNTLIIAVLTAASAFFSAKDKGEVYIYFGSGFHEDTVSFYIDTLQVINNGVLTSDEDYNDLAHWYVKVSKDSVSVFRNGIIVRKCSAGAILNRKVAMVLKMNGSAYGYTMNISKGKYLFISRHQIYLNVYFNQFRKPPAVY